MESDAILITNQTTPMTSTGQTNKRFSSCELDTEDKHPDHKKEKMFTFKDLVNLYFSIEKLSRRMTYKYSKKKCGI